MVVRGEVGEKSKPLWLGQERVKVAAVRVRQLQTTQRAETDHARHHLFRRRPGQFTLGSRLVHGPTLRFSKVTHERGVARSTRLLVLYSHSVRRLYERLWHDAHRGDA